MHVCTCVCARIDEGAKRRAAFRHMHLKRTRTHLIEGWFLSNPICMACMYETLSSRGCVCAGLERWWCIFSVVLLDGCCSMFRGRREGAFGFWAENGRRLWECVFGWMAMIIDAKRVLIWTWAMCTDQRCFMHDLIIYIPNIHSNNISCYILKIYK